MEVIEKQEKGEGWIGIKVDMSKAYGRMEWEFIFTILRNFGFSGKIGKLIQECVSKASSAILLNGSPLSKLKLERGLRQGVPLSLYLFIILWRSLAVLSWDRSPNEFKGISIGNNIPTVSHLMFADDTILFCRAKEEDVDAIWMCVEQYQRWFG